MSFRRVRGGRVVLVVLLGAVLAVGPAAVPSGADGNDAPGAPVAFRSLSVGSSTSCARLDSGQVKCWGNNINGELGQGDNLDRGDQFGELASSLLPVNLGPGRTATAIAAGATHTCARLDDGTVKCWGQGVDGQLGQGDIDNRGDGPGEMGANLPPIALGTGRTAIAVTAGTNHTCALLDNRKVKCWGRNPSGQLGQGDIDNRGDLPGEMGDNLPPIALGTGRTAIAVTAGTNHTCALLDNHQVKCWGNNAAGQLGQGDPNSRGNAPGEMGNNLPPVDLGPGRTATAVSAGSSYTCALLDNHQVKCWGANAAGQLGQGDIDNRGDQLGEMGANLLPISLGTDRTATAITAGATNTTCAVLDNGRAKCWGYNVAGQLGQGDFDNRGDAPSELGDNLPPVDLGPGRTVTAINVGSNHACAQLDNRQIRCWGDNANGQLGLGNTNDRGDQPGEMGTNLPRVPVTLVSCDGRTVTVDRSLGEVPTAAADVILGLAGSETIDGEGGSDRICGGNGNDTLTGSAGNDRLFGQNGNDTLNGQEGTDLLDGGVGNDRLNGGTQQDTCHGRSGTDTQSSCEVRTGIP